MKSLDKDFWKHFWSKVKIGTTDTCWEWNGSISNNRYGRFYRNGKAFSAHVLSYVYYNGEYEKGLWIDHKCMNKKCVNPKHLRAVTPAINATENSDSAAAKNSRKTHCPKGHEYSKSNTFIKILGDRQERRCRICMSEYGRRYHKKKLARQALKEIE